jgi:hypothetical protein
MNPSLNKSNNLFLRNRINNENISSTLKKDYLHERKGKLNFRKSVNFSSYDKGHKKTIELLKKNFLKKNINNFDDSNSDNENSASGELKPIFLKKDKTDKKYNLKGIVNSNKDFKSLIKKKEKPPDNNEIDKSNTNNNTDKTNYFKYSQKKCNSSTIVTSKKISKIYRDFLLKRNNILNKKRGSLIQNTFNINNLKMYNSLNPNKNSITNDNSKNLLKIEPYQSKNIFNNNNKLINKNYLKDNHKLYLFSETNSLNQNEKNSKIPKINYINKRNTTNNLNLINTSFSSFRQDTDDPKRKSFNLNLPSIKSDDKKKSINLKTKKKPGPIIPKSKHVSKNKKKMKEKIPMKKTTTINIYNNKINNINNIILNEKNQIYDNKGEESEFSSILFDSDNLNNKSNRKARKSNLSEKNEIYNNKDKKNINDSEVLKNSKNSENLAIPFSSSNEKIFKINRNKQKRKKTTIFNIKNNNKNYRNKVSEKINKNLIEKLSINYKNNHLNKPSMARYRGENMDKEEINIRQKVLNAFSIKDNSKFNNNLSRIKKETTIKLFEELSRNICSDIEEESKHYKKKEKIIFSQNVMISMENDYISKIQKKSIKLVKKMNKFIFLWKNLLIQIYKRNISEYSKITPDSCKYLFFKYIFDFYFSHVQKLISLDTDHPKSLKNYNLSIIYNSNINNCSFSSSVYKGNENYFHSLFFQYLLMGKDRIQKFSSNERYLEKVINQINSLIQQAKIEMNNMKKTEDVKLNFIVEEKVEDNENGEEGEQELKPSTKSNNFVKRAETKKFTFMNIQKSELSDSDKYDSRDKNEKKNMFFGKLKFNYKSKISFLDKDKTFFGDSNINSKHIDVSTKLHSLLSKKKTFNNDIFHSHYSNMFKTNSNSIECKSLDNKKETLENKYNLAIIKREKIERKYDKIITQNIDSFFKRKKNIKSKKKEKHNEIKKNAINFLKGNYMFKNMIDYRTDEIKLNIKNNIKSPIEMLFYHIKEHDFDEFVELFERKQIDLNSRNKENDSFLIYAVKCKAMKFVLYLLKRGIDVNLENKLGNTALHYAFSDQNFQLADVLLKYGADEFKTNIYGKTPWQCLGKKKI